MHKSKITENKREGASASANEASDAFTLETAFGSVQSTGKETRDFKAVIRKAKEAKAEENARRMGGQR